MAKWWSSTHQALIICNVETVQAFLPHSTVNPCLLHTLEHCPASTATVNKSLYLHHSRLGRTSSRSTGSTSLQCYKSTSFHHEPSTVAVCPMPTPEPDASLGASPTDPVPSGVACPLPPTPPPEEEQSGETEPRDNVAGRAFVSNAEGDNTASGMSIAQEESMYQQQPVNDSAPGSDASRPQVPKDTDMDKPTVPHDYLILRDDVPMSPIKTPSLAETAEPEVESLQTGNESIIEGPALASSSIDCEYAGHNFIDDDCSETSMSTSPQVPTQTGSPSPYPQTTETIAEVASIAQLSAASTPPWDFSNVRLTPQYPSSLLRPGSHFAGTQQSDRQIYNVDVKILTLSVPQSTVTGYLRIQGLTDEHQILTTFFTGEIIGGPYQKYTFQTKHPSWGATDKTDLQHWARFPAWRPLSKDAKRDINFAYPPPSGGLSSEAKAAAGQGWWQRENIFMRWKEWFLVPDHRVTSIQGASFEGFYYICFNQVEGRISGIYFHARSEK